MIKGNQMKLLSLVTLTAMLSLTACSHHKKSCCADKGAATSCTKEDCKKACCDKDKKCADGSCTKTDKKACCSGESCEKKS
jgi:hypothetical protein